MKVIFDLQYGIVHYVYVTIHSSIHQLLECLQKDPKDAGSDQPNFKKKPLEKTTHVVEYIIYLVMSVVSLSVVGTSREKEQFVYAKVVL